MLDARLAGLALAIGLVAAPLPAGSPMICFPIDIGDAASLPFGSRGFEVKSALKPDEIVATVRSVLGKSDDVLVHMETLRRTAIWLMAMATDGHTPAESQRGEVARIESLLTDELLAAAAADGDAGGANPARTRAEALRWFDLGYFRAAGAEAGLCEAGSSRAFLEKAARLLPDDRALSFGVALGEFSHRNDGAARNWATHLSRLFDVPAGPTVAAAAIPASLKKNVLATFGAFLGQDDWDKLGAEVRKHVGRT